MSNPSASDSFRPRVPSTVHSPSAAGQVLANLLKAMAGAGADAEERYARALDEARAQAADVMVEIARADQDTDERNYGVRWTLVYAATQLSSVESLPYLKSVVTTPIPPESSEDPHEFSVVTEETILRTTAIDGLENLATAGDAEAVDILFTALGQPSLSMRRAAVQALLASPNGEQWRDRIREILPPTQHFLLDIRRVGIADVAQVRDPRVHLVEGAGEESEPPPLLPEDRGSPEPRPEGDTPILREP
jgi:hypothetical protein